MPLAKASAVYILDSTLAIDSLAISGILIGSTGLPDILALARQTIVD